MNGFDGTAAPDPAPDAEEARLVERVQRGDTAAFDTLVRRYLRRAFSVAYRLLEHREDAEDLVQEAFVTALEKIKTFDTGRPFAPWFFRILVNRGYNARKARAVRTMEALPTDVAASTEAADRAAERAELRHRIEQAMDGLSERQQLIVKLADLEGFSGPEIAAILGVAPGTVRWHLHQARRVLREALTAEARKTGNE